MVPRARIEVVRFTGAAGRVQDERVFRGPLPRQLRNCLLHLEGLSESHVEKRPHEGRVRAWVSHPRDAVREAVANAVRHRSYRPDVVEPTKVFIHPDRVEVVSHRGPVPGVDPAHPNAGGAPPRNPRVGEFPEELGLAGGRPGGLPLMRRAMARNGSPAPRFDFDGGRRYFRLTLRAHPEHAAVQAMRDAAHPRALGDGRGALERVRAAWEANRDSPVLAAELVRLHADRGLLDRAENVYRGLREAAGPRAVARVLDALVDACLAHDEVAAALRLLREMPEAPPLGAVGACAMPWWTMT